MAAAAGRGKKGQAVGLGHGDPSSPLQSKPVIRNTMENPTTAAASAITSLGIG